MSKKNRNRTPIRQASAVSRPGAPPPAFPEGEEGGVGKKGRVVLLVSLVLIVAGYFFLKKTDPPGKNIYAALSPLFLLSGYLLIFLALWRKEDHKE